MILKTCSFFESFSLLNSIWNYLKWMCWLTSLQFALSAVWEAHASPPNGGPIEALLKPFGNTFCRYLWSVQGALSWAPMMTKGSSIFVDNKVIKRLMPLEVYSWYSMFCSKWKFKRQSKIHNSCCIKEYIFPVQLLISIIQDRLTSIRFICLIYSLVLFVIIICVYGNFDLLTAYNDCNYNNFLDFFNASYYSWPKCCYFLCKIIIFDQNTIF